jgi:hypothetical protein
MDADDNLRFLAHRELRAIVQPRDLKYIEALLPDFVERAKLDPAMLFKHLSSLCVGPLVTREVGVSFADHPSFLKLASGFLQIS